MKINCSVPLLTLNSENTLERCLDSLKDFQDVFLLDGNSTDRTLEIAKNFGVPVFKQVDTDESNVMIENFGAMRIKSASLAKCDWLLMLDSDEFLSDGLIEEIRNNLKKSPDEKKAFRISFWPIIDNRIVKYSFAQKVPYIRLYNKKGGIHWNKNKPVHEKLIVPEDIELMDMKECFYGYTPDFKKCIKKDNFYLSIARKKFLTGESAKGKRKVIFISVFKNLARAVKISFVSFFIYVRHGFSHSLPPKQVWRYIRYHIVISYYRFRQLIV
ncbi:MAG: hypothetical protein COU30_05585 [Candidatus Magasanikbacteria bacterium CG10_big_fil_rev_8_21_14_0_10_38_6]|uniref:Glycosyltransferase 2-like domain-containing protein n=1 Tax=Candidatus Magasanikbacteria bacterium CG10_big_fil_rev_8_21_14_0_10_38_6 TaxID=1974647 RepID=A0A2M6NZJ4_9BACT|nr:MAG: hypothetical protein COU30_05585 [Candidatus Magasanikbacteria bacterium CG10_big_fil_rev_8_21_14_0_10_38_6]